MLKPQNSRVFARRHWDCVKILAILGMFLFFPVSCKKAPPEKPDPQSAPKKPENVRATDSLPGTVKGFPKCVALPKLTLWNLVTDDFLEVVNFYRGGWAKTREGNWFYKTKHCPDPIIYKILFFNSTHRLASVKIRFKARSQGERDRLRDSLQTRFSQEKVHFNGEGNGKDSVLSLIIEPHRPSSTGNP